MRNLFAGALMTFALQATHLFAEVQYQSLAAEGIIVTGVRSDSTTTDDVVLTGSYKADGFTTAALYQGSLAGVVSATISSWNVFNPVFSGQTVTESTFYGPNTSLFSSTIPSGQIRAVGSYKYTESANPNFNHGMMYLGAADGTGTWTQLNATNLVTGGATLQNTIAHSTMGELVVGNYDTSLATGKAFIYHISSDTWFNLNPAGTASVTAYGIWQNSATSYTIAGGASDVNQGGLDYGYLLNYNSDDQSISNFTKFYFDSQPIASLISHFDGITQVDGGFNLTGDYESLDNGPGGFFASVSFEAETGNFGPAQWTEIAFTNAITTSGNTVVGNSVLGIYVLDETTTSYLAIVPEPSTKALFAVAIGLGVLVFFCRRNRARGRSPAKL